MIVKDRWYDPTWGDVSDNYYVDIPLLNQYTPTQREEIVQAAQSNSSDWVSAAQTIAASLLQFRQNEQLFRTNLALISQGRSPIQAGYANQQSYLTGVPSTLVWGVVALAAVFILGRK